MTKIRVAALATLLVLWVTIYQLITPTTTAEFRNPNPKSVHGEAGDERTNESPAPSLQEKTKPSVIEISECGCLRDASQYPAAASLGPATSSCSLSSHRRGPGQKVVAFSYYEPDTKQRDRRIKSGKVKENTFLEGISINIARLQKFYPGFTMRLYHNTSAGDPLLGLLCQHACDNPWVDLCRVQPGTQDLFPMLWRFLPVLDPQVELAMSRDLDSRFTAREAAAVAEWRAGECPGSLHAMRDHPWHGVPVMGGGWGAKLDTELRRKRWADSWAAMLADRRAHAAAATGKGADQDLLRQHVWGVWGRGDACHHDSYTCHMFPGATGWPTQRVNTTDHNFFGAVGPVQFMQVCPLNCRRKGHEEDWVYC